MPRYAGNRFVAGSPLMNYPKVRSKYDDPGYRFMVKFIVAKLAQLVRNNYGKAIYIENCNHVFEDIFDYRKFMTKVALGKADKKVIGTLEDFGMDMLVNICNDPKYYMAIYELVRVDFEAVKLKDKLKKQQKKNGVRKDTRKEFEYYCNLYEKGCKKVRKGLNIPKKNKGYKGKYSGLQSLIKENDEYSSIFDDDYGYYDDERVGDSVYEYMQGDGYGRRPDIYYGSEYGDDFDSFVAKQTRNTRYTPPKYEDEYYSPASPIKGFSVADEDDDFDDEPSFNMFEDYPKRYQNEPTVESSDAKKFDALRDAVHGLTDTVQQLVNNDARAKSPDIDYSTPAPTERPIPRADEFESYYSQNLTRELQDYTSRVDKLDGDMDRVFDKVNELSEDIGDLVNAFKHMEEYLLEDEDDYEEDEVSVLEPQSSVSSVSADTVPELVKQMNDIRSRPINPPEEVIDVTVQSSTIIANPLEGVDSNYVVETKADRIARENGQNV